MPRGKNPSDEPTSNDLGVFEGFYRSGGHDWPLKLQAKIGAGYNFRQPEILTNAMTVFMRHILDDELWSCAQQYGTVSRPDIPAFKDKIYNSIRAEEHNYPDASSPNILYITRFWFQKTNILGFANVGYYNRAREYWINLNSQKVGPNDGPGIFDDPYKWAGIIAHEMLHNLGLRHPHFDSTGQPIDFIYAFGRCFERIARN